MKYMAPINDMAEADQIEYFTRGLHPSMQKEVVLKAPATLDEAIQLVSRYDVLMSSRAFRPANSGYRPYHYQSPFQYGNQRGTSGYSSGSSGGSAPMELGKMEADDTDHPDIGYSPNGDEHTNDGVELFNGMQGSFPRQQNRGRVPNISKEEFTRCRRMGLCLRCKQPGHVARNCNNGADQSRSSSGYPKGVAQRK